MTFTLTNSAGSGSLVLVHGPAAASDTYAQGPIGEGSEFASTQKVDVWPQTRSSWVLVIPRSNHAATLPFRATRQFATTEAAHAWAAAHALAVQALTRLTIVNGAVTVKLHGGMSDCRAAVRGVAVDISYVWTYGQVEVNGQVEVT